jgi:hypothetical protein
MEHLKFLLEIEKKGVNGTFEIVTSVVIFILMIYSLLKRFHKLISYNDFDRLLLPKHERGIQQKLVKLTNYFLFSFIYFIFGSFNSFFLNNYINSIFVISFINLINLIFISSLILILIKVHFFKKLPINIVNKIKGVSKLNIKKIKRYILEINIYSGLACYTFLIHYFIFNSLYNLQQGIPFVFLLSIGPIILLYLYRSYNRKNDMRYICTVINEKEFNNSRLVLHYTLDKDRMIFSKPNDKDNIEIYMYDRTSDKYFKFTQDSFYYSSLITSISNNKEFDINGI